MLKIVALFDKKISFVQLNFIMFFSIYVYSFQMVKEFFHGGCYITNNCLLVRISRRSSSSLRVDKKALFFFAMTSF